MRFSCKPGFGLCFAALALAALAAAGCGGSGQVSKIPVKGRIFYGDQPLRSTDLYQAIVQYHKQGEGGVVTTETYSGKFDEEGNYALEAPAGNYKVIVIATKAAPKKNPNDAYNYERPIPVIPKVYSDPKATEHAAEVKADATPGTYDIKLAKQDF